MSKIIDSEELLKAMESYDKCGIDSHGYMRRITKDKYKDLVPYVHYKDMIEAVENMPVIHAIPIDKVKAVREEISDYNIKEHYSGSDSFLIGIANGMDKAVEILDKLIAESEGKE